MRANMKNTRLVKGRLQMAAPLAVELGLHAFSFCKEDTRCRLTSVAVDPLPVGLCGCMGA